MTAAGNERIALSTWAPQAMKFRQLILPTLVALSLSGCGEQKKSYPTDLVGFWQRQTGPDAWADDTLEFKSTGKVGSRAHADAMATAYWYVATPTVGSPTLCVGDQTGFSCLGFRVTAETLDRTGGPMPPQHFRRVRM